jgi:hypothetical protein
MKGFLHRWRTMLLCLPAALVLGGVYWVCIGMIHGLGVVMSESTEFEYDHSLPRAYEYHMTRNLMTLQEATIQYAQHHRGFLPSMQNSDATITALRPYLQRKIPWRTYNPATQIPFTPNAALSGQKIGDSGRNAVLFYDANPPAGYRESYYVTVIGKVGHVPVAALSKMLQQPTKQ